jgi:hypothetical protein
MHRIDCAEIHSLFFVNGGTMFDSPARRVSASHQVTDIYIRHYQGVLVHVCELLNSPSLETLKSLQIANSAAPVVAKSSIYVAFAACAKFKLFYNGKLVLESAGAYAQTQPYYKLYGSHVSVSVGGIFSISIESCSDSKGFIGCIGPSVCTGINDVDGWWCARSPPPEGWMLPSYNIDVLDAVRALDMPCDFLSENDIWSSFIKEHTDRQCLGLSAFPAATDVVSCSLACCSDPACKMFQWCSGGACIPTTNATGSRCWIGSTSGQNPQTGWVSGTRLNPSDKVGNWMRAQSQGKVTSRAKWVEQGLDIDALWLWPNEVQNEELHCRSTV